MHTATKTATTTPPPQPLAPLHHSRKNKRDGKIRGKAGESAHILTQFNAILHFPGKIRQEIRHEKEVKKAKTKR